MLRLTLNAVAPAAPDHVSVTRPSPARAESAVGAVSASHDRIALFTSSRPPLVVTDSRLGMCSTVLSSASFNAAVSSAQCESTSAAAPATCGVAMDVPLKKAYVFPIVVERMSNPGAPRWTDAAP